MKKILAALVVLATVLLPLRDASGQTVTVKVSNTLLGLNQKWAAAYQAGHPAVTLQVTGADTPAVLAALADKQADLVLVPRAMRYKEAQACQTAFGRRPAEAKVAVSGVAVYVNSTNPVQVVSYDELAAIFGGQSQNWKELDGGRDQPISVYAPATNSVQGELFNEEVLNGRGFPAGVHLLAGPELLQTVAADPAGIGLGTLTPEPGVQTLSIKRAPSSTPVKPTEDNIARRMYPLSRYVFSYSNPAANPEAIKAYLDWIRSDEGQQIAREAGFYPLPAILRSSP
jgi:phosphate transport system substrate-binding protein